MKNLLKTGAFLAAICGLAAGLLYKVFSETEPIIKENERLAAIKKRKELFNEADTFTEMSYTVKGDTRKVWTGRDKNGRRVGAVIEVAPRGYSGPIKVSIGVMPGGRVGGVAINKLDQSETPGLGTKIVHPNFKEQFKGKSGNTLKLKKDGGEIDTITAATISSRAVANGVLNGWEWYMLATGEEKEINGSKNE